MKTHRLILQHVLIAAVFIVPLAGTTGSAHAERQMQFENPGLLGEYVHRKLFGDYGPIYVLRDKTSRRYVKGQQVVPQEGLFSSAMRSMAGRLHNGVKQANYRSPSDPFTRFHAYNLAVNVPEKGWVQLDPKEQGMGSCLLLSRSNPDIVISLEAEAVGVKAKETNSSLLAVSQESMKSLPNSVILPGVWKLSSPSLKGYLYHAATTFDNGQQLQFSIWVATKNGYNYSLTVYGDLQNKQAIDETMKEFVGRLCQIKPNHVARVVAEPTMRR